MKTAIFLKWSLALAAACTLGAQGALAQYNPLKRPTPAPRVVYNPPVVVPVPVYVPVEPAMAVVPAASMPVVIRNPVANGSAIPYFVDGVPQQLYGAQAVYPTGANNLGIRAHAIRFPNGRGGWVDLVLGGGVYNFVRTPAGWGLLRN